MVGCGPRRRLLGSLDLGRGVDDRENCRERREFAEHRRNAVEGVEQGN